MHTHARGGRVGWSIPEKEGTEYEWLRSVGTGACTKHVYMVGGHVLAYMAREICTYTPYDVYVHVHGGEGLGGQFHIGKVQSQSRCSSDGSGAHPSSPFPP